MTDLTSSPLPSVYAKWLDELLGGEIPSETRATCHDCAMCESGGEYQKPGSRFFNPERKCCTYVPRLHNFLAGMILTDEDPAMARGRASVEARLDAGVALTPLGLEQPPKMKSLYNLMETRAFGRAQSLLCPHYINESGGLCAVWKYRNSVCSTWFCKYVRGGVGRNFWEAVKRLLMTVEDDLSRWCAIELELDEAALDLSFTPDAEAGHRRLTLEDIDDQVDPDRQRRLWGDWYGREREFYRACAELVAPLKWLDALAICGPETRARARSAQKAYQVMTSEEIPERLRMGAFTIVGANGDFYRLYHPDIGMDVFSLSARVMRLLPYFDGRTTTEIVAQIAEKEGMRFTAELLRRLVDFGILIAVDQAGARE
jgi:hypothetical protein